MAIHIACPSCQQRLAVDESERGTVVACAQCGKKLRVPRAADQPSRAQGVQQAPPPLPQAVSSPKSKPIPYPDEDSLEEDRDWERPRRKRARYDDEDDYRPVRKSKRGSSLGLWLGIGGGALALAAVAVVVVILVLKKSTPAEPNRHYERAGGFSYVPVPGWQVRDFPGLKFKVVVGPPAQGFAPNLNFIPENSPLAIADYVDASINTLKAMFPNCRVLGKQPFTTDQGLQGFKLIEENKQGNFLLRQHQYIFGNGNQKIVITGSALVNAGAQFDAVMDGCAKSFRFE
jgi:hypothetical protein